METRGKGMALDEEALEAMLRRQQAVQDDDSNGQQTVTTHQTEEFEVYERATPRPDSWAMRQARAEGRDPPPAAPAPQPPSQEETPTTEPPQETPAPAATPPAEDAPDVPETPATAEEAPTDEGTATPPEQPEAPPAVDPPGTDSATQATEGKPDAQPPYPATSPPQASLGAPAWEQTETEAPPAAEPGDAGATEASAPEPDRVHPPLGAARPMAYPPATKTTAGEPPATTQSEEAPDAMETTQHAEPDAEEPAAQEDPWRHGTPAATPPPTAPGDEGPRIAIVQGLFNKDLTDMMTEWSKRHATALGAEVTHHLTVPGVFDTPLAAQTLARRDDVDCVVVIGCVIQGETGHDQIITQAAAHQLARIACDTGKPVAFGVSGPRMTRAQAEARIGLGKHAVESAVAQWRVLKGQSLRT